MQDLMRQLERGDARKRKTGDSYDPACERIDTAIKAIWLLYRSGRWTWLEQLGLSRKEMGPLFIEFDFQFITTDHGLLYQEATVHKLTRFEFEKRGTQKILDAAREAIARYIWAFQDERRYYYERLAA